MALMMLMRKRSLSLRRTRGKQRRMGISVKVTMVMMATRWIGRICSSEREDMAVVTAMMREAAVDGVTLRVEGMHVPDCDLACEAAGKLLWGDEEKLKCCLSCTPGGDDESAVEKWGALIKWWRNGRSL